MEKFLKGLLSGDETGIDSVIACSIFSLLIFFTLTVYAVLMDHSSWNPITFATSSGTIIGIGAGGKTVRDKFSNANSPNTTTN